jgi:3-hydroxyacyl-CoA dehydrogenase, C-terminal domain
MALQVCLYLIHGQDVKALQVCLYLLHGQDVEALQVCLYLLHGQDVKALQVCLYLLHGQDVEALQVCVLKVDKVIMSTFGMPMGPFRLNDLVGTDIGVHVGKNFVESFGERVYIATLLPMMLQAKRLGEKTGKGFYQVSTAASH